MNVQEPPEYVRISSAAAMALGFIKGIFYRNAVPSCINLLLTYQDGCIGADGVYSKVRRLLYPNLANKTIKIIQEYWTAEKTLEENFYMIYNGNMIYNGDIMPTYG